MKEWTREMKEMKEMIKQEIRKQGKETREEIETMKGQLREREEEWRREKEKMEDRIKRLEKRVEERKRGMGEEKEENKGDGIKRKVKEIEEKMERMERKERKKNIIIKGIIEEEKEAEEKFRRTMQEIGVEVEIEKIRRLGKGKERERGAAIITMRSIEEKKQIMVKRKELKKRGIWIDNDLTWRERKMRWKLGEIASEERRKGRKVWIGYGKLEIEGERWEWEEGTERLKNNRGEVWWKQEVRGEEREGRKVGERTKEDKTNERQGEGDRRTREEIK